MENASKAGLQTKIAAVEDEANVIYLDLNLKKLKGEIQEVTMQNIADKLNENDYKVKKVPGSGNKVTGISVEPTSLNLGIGQTGTITVKPEENTAGNSYYAIIDGKYYKINFSSQGITVNRTESDIEDSSGETQNLTASSSNKNVVEEPSINGMKVSVTAGTTVGESTITITYGEYTKEVKVTVKVKPTETSTETKNVNFSTAYGKIDVIWLEGETNNVAKLPNAPELYSGANALTPVTWTKNGDTWEDDSKEQTEAKGTWYNYAEVEGTGDSNDNNMWANAKNKDGSYFVWIPRYAYRITYYAEDPNTNTTQSPTGYYDGLGMWNAKDGSLVYSLEKDASGNKIVETVEHDGEEYIVHPAFTSNLDLGGWGKNTKGFWVAKYEISMENDKGISIVLSSERKGNAAISDTIKAVSKPEVSSWRYINIANCYNNSYDYDRAKASTTGNIYGVYDISGGAWEYTAVFNKEYTGEYFSNDNSKYNPATGNHFATQNGASTKYATAYSNNILTNKGAIVYTVGKTGDGIKEVYTGSSDTSWHRDKAYVVQNGSPLLRRGGYAASGTNAGVFCSNDASGGYSVSTSFRIVLGM